MKKYKILAIFVLTIAMFMFFGTGVDAKSGKTYNCPYSENDAKVQDWYRDELFGMKYDINDDLSKLTLIVSKDIKDKNGNAVVMRVESINGAAPSKQYEVYYKGNDKGTTIPIDKNKDENLIILKTTTDVHVQFKDILRTKEIEIRVNSNVQRGKTFHTTAEYDSSISTLSVSESDIDCSYMDAYLGPPDKLYTFSSFKDKFCYTKQMAIKAGNVKNLGSGERIDKNEVIDNKCSVNAKKITSTNYDSSEYEDQYYQNRKYYYASSEFTYDNLGQYKYNFYPGENYGGEKLSCKLTCQEAVSVEYGPPVASKAGLCFEYKVKVTSRVHCYVSVPPPVPTEYKSECTPGPICYGVGMVFRQGGPKEEFDSCVKDCDGGKYTTKCSNKCYEKVYGKKINNKKAQKTGSVSSAVEECARNSSYHGCYYRTSTSGSITWYGLGGYNIYAPGRWYHFNAWGLPGYIYYTPLQDGIYRAQEGNGYCTDYCYWISSDCAWNEYLNPGQSQKDWEANKKIYEEAVETCQAKAKCNTTTTEFQISTQYYRAKDEKGNKEKVVVHFPYTSESDVKVNGNIKDNASSPDQLNTCDKTSRGTVGRKSTTVLKYDWCYDESCPTDEIAYMSEWSFPGTWVNKKTGVISFDAGYEGNSAWRSKPNKFCIPRDALGVNSAWYQWYFHKVEKTQTDIYDGQCLTSEESEAIKHENYSDYKTAPTDEWNIYAKTREFGYFKWNFDIYCFYALPSNGGTGKDPNCADGYRTRTVSIQEMFPEPCCGPNASGESEKRDVGYNWTNDASLKNQSLPDSYKVDPETTLANIENAGNTIYANTNYIDYQFKITPSDIKKIKQYNSQVKSFDVYCGKLKSTEDRFAVYQSNLFRSGEGNLDSSINACKSANNGILVGTSAVQKLGTIGVNNQ